MTMTVTMAICVRLDRWWLSDCSFGRFTFGQVRFFLIRHNVPVNIVILYLIWTFLGLSTGHDIRYGFTNGHAAHHRIYLFVVLLTELEVENKFDR
jgi:hypothetical protein